MPKKSETAFSKGFSRLDIFDDPIQLNSEGQTTLRSNLGGIISAVVVLFLFAEFIIQIVAISKRQNLSVVQFNEYHNNPPGLYLNSSNNFVFAVGMTINNQNVNISSNALVSFTGMYVHQTRSSSGVVTRSYYSILWEPCTADQFPSSLFGNNYDSLSLQYAYCPTGIDWTDLTTLVCPDDIKSSYPDCITPMGLEVQGTFLDPEFDYVQFKLLPTCDPTASATVKGLTCTTDSQSTIFDSSEVKLNLYYSNVLVDPLNYDSPNTSYIDTLYWNVDPSVSKVTDIYIDSTTIQDYDDYWSTSKNSNRTFYNINSGTAQAMQAFNIGSMLEWNFRRSHLNLLTMRNYSKILDVVSNIGGLSKILIVIGAFIAMGYNRYKHQMMLSNRLYDFQSLEKKLIKKQTTTLRASNSIELDKPKKSQTQRIMSKLSLSIKEKPTSATDEAIKDYFALKTKKAETLRYNELTYFKSIFSRLCSKVSDEVKLGNKAREQIMRDLDIIKIVEKIKEIDKLKFLLLNRHQREAFDFIEKPLITLKDRKPQQRGSIAFERQDLLDSPDTPDDIDSNESPKLKRQDNKLFKPQEEYNSISKYSRLYRAYINLKEDTDPRNWKYNKKLLNMIGKELMEVFQRVDEVMGDSIDPKRFDEVIQEIVNKPLIESPDSPTENLPLETAVTAV